MKPTQKAPKIADLLEMLAHRTSSIEGNVCVPKPIGCGQQVTSFRDATSEREYTISGLCQQCQDKIFGA